MTSKAHSAVLPTLLALVSAIGLGVVAGCSGSGSSGSGGDFRLVATIFGFDRLNGGFPSTGANGQPPTIPQNMCLIFEFSAAIDPNTVNTESIIVQEVNLNTNPPSPGPDAAASFEVRGNQLVVCPLITFSDTNVSYGFEPMRSYQLIFEIEPAPSVMRSTSGRGLGIKDSGPYIFQTSSDIFDRVPGPPQPTLTVLDAQTGADVGTVGVPFKPVPLLQIDFNEPVIPTTVISDAKTGAAASLSVEIDLDGDVEGTPGDRIVIPGQYMLVQDSSSARVSWVSLLSEIPTAAAGCAYVVTVDGTVTDLAGNSKVLESNDPSARDEFVFFTASGPSSGPSDGALEDFSTRDNESSVTSANWGTVLAGLLTSGVGGGTGKDGVFDPLNLDFPPPDLAAQIQVDQDLKVVTVQTEDLDVPGTQRVYEFLRFDLPIGWTVDVVGPFPLQVQVSGDASIRGLLDASGEDGAINAAAQVTAGAGGAAALGGAAGGDGGSVTDALGTSTLFPGSTGAVSYAELGYRPPIDASQGISGRISGVAPGGFSFTESQSGVDFSTFFGGVDGLWVQPNVGADDYRFERYHTSFKVVSLVFGAGVNTITIESNTSSPDYRGPIDVETDNPQLGSDFRAPLLAELGDAFIIGRLEGQPGGDLFDTDLDGGADPTIYTSGRGSASQAVSQTFTTLAKSGGGGGGGAQTAGVAGTDDPTVSMGPGVFGGTGGVGGAGGGATATLTVFETPSDATTLRFVEQIFDDGMGGATFVGHLINPQIGQGQVFTIASVNADDECVIAPIETVGGDRLDLSTVVDLVGGSTARLSPPYTVGGTGGGGAGLHCAGSSKDAKGNEGYEDDTDPGLIDDFFDDFDDDLVEDASEEIFVLPRWVAGAGGGAGGGSVRFVIAGEANITSTGEIRADGGAGGSSEVTGAAAPAGGGGGAGGSVFLGVGRTIRTSPGARISAAGGEGGALDGEVPGGRGGNGRIRLENQAGDLVPGAFTGLGTPPLAAENLGAFPGGGNSLGQSDFLSGSVLVPDYQSITVTYNYDQGTTSVQDATYRVNRDGSVASSSTLMTPPFQLLLNFTTADPDTGLPIDPPPPMLADFVDPTDDMNNTTLGDFAGTPYFRFRIVLDDPSNPVYPQINVQISRVRIEVNGSKP